MLIPAGESMDRNQSLRLEYDPQSGAPYPPWKAMTRKEFYDDDRKRKTRHAQGGI